METNLQLGQTIKFYRHLRNMSQDSLAVGICTSSYLSRIENGLVEPEEVIYKLLFERLELNYDHYIVEGETQLNFIEDFYLRLLSNESITDQNISHLEEIMKNRNYPGIQLKVELVYSRYLVSQKRNKEANEILSLLEPLLKPGLTREWQLFVAVKTYYELSVMEYESILKRELQTNSIYFFSTATPYEKASYLYHLAYASHRAYQFKLAKHYISEAIKVFSHLYKPLFQLKLYSLNGVILNALGQLEEALKEYYAAIDLLNNVESISTKEQWASIYNNLAFAYESQANNEKAIKYYEQSLAAKYDFHTMINYLRTLMFSNRKDKFLKYVENLSVEEMSQSTHHYYQLKLMLAFNELDKSSIEQFLNIEKVAIKHFIEQHHLELILYYGPRIAKICEEFKQYKRATELYRLLFETSENMRKSSETPLWGH